MKFDFKDFPKTQSAGLETQVRVANRWAAEIGAVVLNVETLMANQYVQLGIRVWYQMP